LIGWRGGGMTHPLFIGLSSLGRVRPRISSSSIEASSGNVLLARSPFARRAKNECHAMLVRRLITKPAVSDLFGLAGRQWLRELELPLEER
jgi:hypothetical protein